MHVGIFWWYHGQLIAAGVPLCDGIDDGDFINGPDDHYAYWETERGTRPTLRSIEYDAVPRGRVLYKKAEGRCYVYMDTVLHRENVKKLLMSHFALPAETVFATDSHYTTRPAELGRLFDDHPAMSLPTRGSRRHHPRAGDTT